MHFLQSDIIIYVTSLCKTILAFNYPCGFNIPVLGVMKNLLGDDTLN